MLTFNDIKLSIIRNFIIFIIGGLLYYLIELLYRGYSHYTMIILGGLCFILIGLMNENIFEWEMSVISQMFLSCIIISILELIFGYILNIKLNLQIWSYIDQPYNLYGQICLLYTVFWFWLSLPCILIDDWLRHKLFKSEYKKYIIL